MNHQDGDAIRIVGLDHVQAFDLLCEVRSDQGPGIEQAEIAVAELACEWCADVCFEWCEVVSDHHIFGFPGVEQLELDIPGARDILGEAEHQSPRKGHAAGVVFFEWFRESLFGAIDDDGDAESGCGVAGSQVEDSVVGNELELPGSLGGELSAGTGDFQCQSSSGEGQMNGVIGADPEVLSNQSEQLFGAGIVGFGSISMIRIGGVGRGPGD